MNNLTGVAEVIFNQIGGIMFLLCTGCKQLVGEEYSLTMKLVENKSGASTLMIVLDPSDTYTMHFMDDNGGCVVEHKDVYCDQLQQVFESVTGLYTHF